MDVADQKGHTIEVQDMTEAFEESFRTAEYGPHSSAAS